MTREEDANRADAEYRMQDYYHKLSAVCFPTLFISLTEEEIASLASGSKAGPVVDGVVDRIGGAVKNLPRPRFVSVDSFAPKDTERFREK